ncbi:hypothetical protein [Pedobacter gandavensis]|uniref:Uncharacterized protein n=1 Tax=Pedobacter gandavensis TaxID=2679963 RepID=A0ABR6EYF3_9SPHI|nr:hypothetical protein [Pedobacter gandavensis]MBB2150300.1 hypothetical protein [Pedobacter gandavensis]
MKKTAAFLWPENPGSWPMQGNTDELGLNVGKIADWSGRTLILVRVEQEFR